MKRLSPRAVALALLAVLCAALGCLPTYVGDPTKSVADARYIGIWHHANDKNASLWAVHKMDEHCYLVQAYNFTSDDAGAWKTDSQLTCRAWLAPIGDKTFISLEHYDPRMLLESGKDKLQQRYLVAAIRLEGDSLSVRGVDYEFVKKAGITTPEQFEAALKKATDADDVYTEETTYTRVKDGDEKLKPLLDLLD